MRAKFHWGATECFGIQQAVDALNEAEAGGSLDNQIVFLGQAIIEEPSLISNRTPTPKPFFVVFARFPEGSRAQQV
jgi:hypothetical protein